MSEVKSLADDDFVVSIFDVITGDPDHDFGTPTEEEIERLDEFLRWWKKRDSSDD